MNEDDNNLHAWIEPELEARVVAWVLGEASAFEVAELERMAAAEPELAAFKQRIETTHRLAHAAILPDREPLRLSPDRRRKLLEVLGTKPAATRKRNHILPFPRPAWLKAGLIARVAACLVVAAVVTMVFTTETGLHGVLKSARRAVTFSADRKDLPNEDRSAPPTSATGEASPALAEGGQHMQVRAQYGIQRQDYEVPLDRSSDATRQSLDMLRNTLQGSEAQRALAGTSRTSTASSSLGMQKENSAPSMEAPVESTATDEIAMQRAAPAQADENPAAGTGGGVTGGQDVALTGVHAPVLGDIPVGRMFKSVAPSSDSQSQPAVQEYKDGAVAISSNGIDTRTGSGEAQTAAATESAAAADKIANAPTAVAAMPVPEAAPSAPVPMEAEGYGSAVAAATPEADRPSIGGDYAQAVGTGGLSRTALPKEPKHAPEFANGTSEGYVQYGAPIELPQSPQTAEEDSSLATSSTNVSKEIAQKTEQSADREATGKDLRLQEAEGFLQTGRYDLATKRAEEVLADDQDNAAAKQMIVEVNEESEKYRASAYDETRARMPETATLGWSIPVTGYAGSTVITSGERRSGKAVDMLMTAGGSIQVAGADDAGLNQNGQIKNPAMTTPPELDASAQPFSTFSLHVADVSFQLAKDAIERGQMPDPQRIRPEEFYNAFDYGDPAPGVSEQVSCHIEQCAHPFLQQRNLVRIAMKVAAAGRAANRPLRLTILLDTSGSMEREDRAASVRRALAALASLLGPDDRVTLVGFAREPRLLAEQVPGSDAGRIVQIAQSTPSEGGTNLEAALDLAGKLAVRQHDPKAQNRVVLLTDGAANLGNADPSQLSKKVESMRQQGISFDACGVGANGLDDAILEALTRKGGGRYYFLNKPEDAGAGFAGQLAGALRPAAENVKVQVKFNPARVGKYRLVGFDAYRLKTEDFRNDRVGAAELSADEAAVALYQVEPLPGGEGELGEVIVRFRDPASGTMVERSWTLPYDEHAPAFDRASPALRLAGSAALVAEYLRGDRSFELEKLAPIVAGLPGAYPNQARVNAFVTMFERLRR
jgi:Mg-chelatase subunit ChlD